MRRTFTIQLYDRSDQHQHPMPCPTCGHGTRLNVPGWRICDHCERLGKGANKREAACELAADRRDRRMARVNP